MAIRTVVALLLAAVAVAAQSGRAPKDAGPPKLAVRDAITLRYDNAFVVGEIKGKIAPARAILLPKPVYSDDARRIGAEGDVRVDIIIAADGTVASAKPVSGAPELFDSVRNAALGSRFLPPGSEIGGYLIYEFAIKPMNWFAVSFDLRALEVANPAVIRKTIPKEWTEERALADRLVVLGVSSPIPGRPTLSPARVSGSANQTTVRAEVIVPAPSAELRSTVVELVLKLRSRLSGKELRQFDLAAAMIKALVIARESGSSGGAAGVLKPFADDPQGLPEEWTKPLGELVRTADSAAPAEFNLKLRSLIQSFRSSDQQ